MTSRRQVQQTAGALTYAQRAEIGRDLSEKSSAWRDEVKAVQDRMGLTYREALVAASNIRKTDGDYQSIAERRVASYKPRVAANVNCVDRAKCPGAYDRPAGPRYPGPAVRKTRVTAAGAEKLLRALYHQRGRELGPSDRLKTPSARGRFGYRSDKSRVSSMLYEACPTKVIQTATGPRHIADAAKGSACRNNWRYASTIKHQLLGHRKRFGGFGDVRGVDDGVKDASYLKGFRVMKPREAAPKSKASFSSPYFGKQVGGNDDNNNNEQLAFVVYSTLGGGAPGQDIEGVSTSWERALNIIRAAMADLAAPEQLAPEQLAHVQEPGNVAPGKHYVIHEDFSIVVLPLH
jgi:hypothetical protein